MKMNKKLKRILTVILAVAVLCGAVWGILTAINAAKRGAVNVYSVVDCGMTDYWGDDASTSGSVETDKLQKVYMSGTQTIKQVYVSEGQSVSKGDKLLSYDTTLSALDIERAKIDLERSRLQLDEYKNELSRLNTAQDKSTLEAKLAELQRQLEAAIADEDGKRTETPVTQISRIGSGDGSIDKPLYFECPSSTELDQTVLKQLYAGKQSGELYVVLVIREGDIRENAASECWGYRLRANDAGEVSARPVSLSEWEDPVVEPGDEVKRLQNEVNELQKLVDESYTKAEIVKLISDKKSQISDTEIAIKMSQLEIKRMQHEIGGGVVYAELDGIVKASRDPNEAYASGEAVVEVSGGGGYYVTGYLSELDLGSVQVGQAVQISSWMNGTSCEGEIVEISSYPADNAEYYGDGNSNVSYYPFKVFVGEDAELNEGDYVDMSYTRLAEGESNSLYLQNMFIRTDNGKSYVYVRGEDGKLEKRVIQTGKDVWGSYTQIRGGLTAEDYIAFPYGRDVTDGAPTNEATIDALYGGY